MAESGYSGGVLVAGVSVGWRFFSRRRALPCPPWLEGLLENPYMNAVAGSEALLDRLDVQPGMAVLDVGTWLAFTLNFAKPA